MADEVRFLQVEPTTRCNFACQFCVGRRLPQQDMPMAVFESLLRAWPGLRHIELQGEGEPLLHPEFFAMVRRAKDLQPSVRISMITNGSLLTVDNARSIVDLGSWNVNVSIESANPEVFRQVRRGRLESLLDGIHALLEARRASRSDRPTIGLAVTVLRRTVAEVPGVLRLYGTLGLDGGAILQPLQAMPGYVRYYDDKIRRELLTGEDAAQLKKRLDQEPRFAPILRQAAKAGSFYDELYATTHGDVRACPWLAHGLYVTAGGRLTSCCFQKDPGANDFGRVGEVTADEVLQRRRALADSLRRGHLPAGCHGCPVAMKAFPTRATSPV